MIRADIHIISASNAFVATNAKSGVFPRQGELHFFLLAASRLPTRVLRPSGTRPTPTGATAWTCSRQCATGTCSPPKPFSQNFILRLRTSLVLFVLSLWQDFLKSDKLVLLSFSKIIQVRRTAASMKCCSQGLGGNSQQAKMEKTCVIQIFHFSHLYIQMPCLPRCYCPVYKGLTPAFVYAKIKAQLNNPYWLLADT